MADNVKPIAQRIQLDGEKEYSAALKQAQRNLRVLRSELKAETAELGKNATEQQKNEVRLKNLQKQIKEQEKVVKTYEAALQEVKDRYGDNDEAVAKWSIKLNDAKTALANMKNQLDQTGESVKSVGTGAKQSAVETYALAESFGKIGQAAESMSSIIESVFSGILGTIKETIGAVWGDMMDIAAKADNYMDLAAFLGASATDVQKWDNAMKAAHGDLSTITNMITKLKYGGKEDLITQYFGISGEGYTNDLEYVQQVLQQMADSKDEMVANGTWAKAMGEIFGAKKVQEIDSILSDWDEIIRNLREFDVENGGVGNTAEELQTMNELYSQVGLLQTKWDTFKKSVEARMFGKLALDLTSNAQGALDALIAFMDADTAEEKQAAIDEFQKNITEAFKKIGEAIQAAAEALDKAGEELQGSENGYVRLLGDVLRGLSDAMEWLTKPDSLEKVKNFFTGVFDVLIGLKAISAIGRISQLVTNLVNLKNVLPTLFGLGGNKTPTVNTTTSNPKTTGGTDVTWLTSLLTKVGQGAYKLASTAGSELLGLLPFVAEDQTVFGRTVRNGGSLGEAASASWETIKASAAEGTKNFTDYFSKQLPDAFWSIFGYKNTNEAASTITKNMQTVGDWTYDDSWTIEEIMADMARREAEMQKTTEEIVETVQTLVDEIDGGDDPRFSVEDLPADWWENFNNGNGTSDAMKTLPGLTANAVARSVSGIKVYMDGEVVGRLVSPYVSQDIARAI